MPILSLLYASTARLDAAERDIAEIVALSRVHNARQAITGMLLFADGRFAQLLEGDERAVMALLARIAIDARHAGLRVVLEDRRAERRLPGWSMAYAGPSSYVGGHIRPLVDGRDPATLNRASLRLIGLMLEFSRRDVSRRYSDY